MVVEERFEVCRVALALWEVEKPECGAGARHG